MLQVRKRGASSVDWKVTAVVVLGLCGILFDVWALTTSEAPYRTVPTPVQESERRIPSTFHGGQNSTNAREREITAESTDVHSLTPLASDVDTVLLDIALDVLFSQGIAHRKKHVLEALESLLPYVSEDWSACSTIFHLHIAKTGGHTFELFVTRTLGVSSRHSFWRYVSWKSEDAYDSVDFMRNAMRTGRIPKLFLGVEVGPVLLHSSGYEWDSDTCFVIVMREPLSWLTSAFNHAIRAGQPYSFEPYFGTRNVQAKFFYEALRARSVTVVEIKHQKMFYALFRRFWERTGRPVGNLPPRSYVNSHSESYIRGLQWGEWARNACPLDLEIYDQMFNSSRNHHVRGLSSEAAAAMRDLGVVHLRGNGSDAGEQFFPDHFNALQRITNRPLDIGKVEEDLEEYLEEQLSEEQKNAIENQRALRSPKKMDIGFFTTLPRHHST